MQAKFFSAKNLLVFLVVVFSVGILIFQFQKNRNELSVRETPVSEEPSYPHTVPPGSTIFTVLRELNVSSVMIQEIVNASNPLMDLSRIRAGTQFRLIHLTDPLSDLVGIEFYLSPVESVLVKKNDGVWKAEKLTSSVETQVVTFRGVVDTSLWESAEKAQMDPNLIVQLAEIFAWQVDFGREVRANDRWRLSVERFFVRGRPVGWGSILAAEYENSGRLFSAVLYRVDGEHIGYFDATGGSLRRMFLKSPIRYGRISSRFQRKRFHPVLKIHRPHLGVDYAAPTGTPVRSVGDGLITTAGWMGGGGRTIKIRHNASYQTSYLHLSRFEKGIRAGVRVKQGQTIGYVGSTGLASGPHLHFEFAVNGRVVDPLGQKFPAAEPVSTDQLANFKEQSAQLFRELPSWDVELIPIGPWLHTRWLREADADPLRVEP